MSKKEKSSGNNKKKIKKEIEHEYFVMDDVVYFELKGRAKKEGIFAMVSLNKWPYVSKYDWYLGKNGYPCCYELGKIQLHRFVYTYIFGQYPPSNLYVDHIDRNKLNNTDDNLRLATPQENSFNKSTESNKKGVKKISDGNYSATIVKDGTRHEIKNIPTENQAAEIYNLMAEELFGTFAAFNKVN
ncbi:mg680 protein [Tupanvirus deep ocean]|uniref:Mg680 protein n=2 Tax=Tupanvirus TaxID=2094720 RepID=A0AC62A7E9_9VIRU|nr:mg680 protein [Tupanvirus deep ocean]QKU33654.1 mg680 protein [Tupanvirus deep ocean]